MNGGATRPMRALTQPDLQATRAGMSTCDIASSTRQPAGPGRPVRARDHLSARVGHRSLRLPLRLLHVGEHDVPAKAPTCSRSRSSTGCAAPSSRAGVRKLRLTGGEPLVRRDIMTLVPLAVAPSRERRARRADAHDQRLAACRNTPHELAGCGVKRINVSLDTLDPDKFRAITRWGDLGKVLAGIDAAQAAGLEVKINAVALKGVNEDEIAALVRMGARARHGPHADRGDAARRGRRGPARSISAALAGAGAARRALHARGDRLSHRRAGPLCPGRRDRRPARLHHAAHP